MADVNVEIASLEGNCPPWREIAPLGGKNCSIKEQREMALIEKNLEFSKKGYWIVEYPWIKNPERLPDNKSYAYNLLVQTEKRLKKDSKFKRAYCDQIQDMFTRNVARKLSQYELASYKGSIQKVRTLKFITFSTSPPPLLYALVRFRPNHPPPPPPHVRAYGFFFQE